jgi:two-component system, NarL family, response regulator NreC
MKKIRVLLADDHKIVRDGLKALVDRCEDMEVVAEAECGRKAVSLARKHNPDIVIMDISMPNLNGIDATRQILEEVKGVKVIALSMHSDRQYVNGMLRAGVSGYLLKDCAADELIQCVRFVLAGRTCLSPGITGLLVNEYIQPAKDQVLADRTELSAREREVLQLIAEGRSTKDIAVSLYISVKTVETHRKNIMEKANLHTVADLTKYAIRHGLTSV